MVDHEEKKEKKERKKGKMHYTSLSVRFDFVKVIVRERKLHYVLHSLTERVNKEPNASYFMILARRIKIYVRHLPAVIVRK